MWRLLLSTASPDDQPIGELTAATARKFTWNLDDACAMAFSMDGRHPQAALVEEIETDATLYHDDQPFLRCRMGSSSDDLDSTSHTVQFSGVDYRGLLARRYLWYGTSLDLADLDTLTYTISQQEQTEIAWALIDGTQQTPPLEGDVSTSWFGVQRGLIVETGQLRDRTYYVGDNIGSLLDNLGRVINGYEWEISGYLFFNTFYPQRGRQLDDVVLHFGSSVVKVQRTVDTSTFANASMVTGGQQSLYYPGVAEIDGDQFGLAGRWEAVETNTDITDQASATDKAQGNLAASGSINPSYSLTLSPGWWTPDKLWLGDTVRVVIQSGRLNVNAVQRVSQVTLDLDDDGGETVTISTGPFVPTLTDIVRSSARQIERLSTR